MHDGRTAPMSADARELFQPLECVECVTGQKLRSCRDRRADALVLVTPIRLHLRHVREVEVEVCCAASGPSRAREDDAEDVCMLVFADDLPKGKQLTRSLRRVPLPHESRGPCNSLLQGRYS